jgi:histidinol phosphatase-like enzyme
MIEKLEPNRGYDEDGTLVWEGPCDEWSMMEKINELVEAINRMEKQIEKLQVL